MMYWSFFFYQDFLRPSYMCLYIYVYNHKCSPSPFNTNYAKRLRFVLVVTVALLLLLQVLLVLFFSSHTTTTTTLSSSLVRNNLQVPDPISLRLQTYSPHHRRLYPTITGQL